MKKKYSAYFHNGRLIPAIVDGKQDLGTWNWDETTGDEIEKLGKFETIDKALEAIYASSSIDFFNSFVIEDEEGSEVYSDILEYFKCQCCGHEEYNRGVSDLRRMKNKEGKPLFPDIV